MTSLLQGRAPPRTCRAGLCVMSRRLSEEGRAYYQRVESIVDAEDFNTDDASLFIANLFEQVVKDGPVRVFCDKVASRVLEKVFQKCPVTPGNTMMLMKEIQSNLSEICSNSSGSHALEAFLLQAVQECKRGSNSASRAVEESVLNVCSSVLESFEEYLTDFWANHVVRCLLQVLSGVRVADGIVRSKTCAAYRSKNAMSVQSVKKKPSQHQQQHHVLDRRDVPEQFVACLDRFGKKLCKQKPLEDLLCDENVSPVYEVALVVLTEKSPERGQKLVKKILKCTELCSKSPEEKVEVLESLPSLFCDTIGSRVIEVLVEVLSPELLQMVYHQSFRHRVMQMALHPVANYVLQCFFTRANAAQVAMAFDEVDLGRVLAVGHSGVVVKLAAACVRCPERQRQFCSEVLSAVHCTAEPNKCLPLLLALETYELHYSGKEGSREKPADTSEDGDKVQCSLSISLHGALLVQAMLCFEDTKLLASCISRLPLPSLIHMACHPSGSHVLEAFLNSKTVEGKRREKVMKKLKGNFFLLAKDKHGSRSVDAVWASSEVGTKREIALELLEKEDELKDDYYGRFVLRNCQIDTFKRKQGVWQEAQETSSKTKQLFGDILDQKHGSSSRVSQKGAKRGKSVSSQDMHGSQLGSANSPVKRKKIALF